MNSQQGGRGTVDLSVIVPVYNEEAVVEATLRETAGVLRQTPFRFEILAIDDGSADATPWRLQLLRKEIAELRILTLRPNSGQSAAFGAGFRHARGAIIVTMDADGQNDPADIPQLVDALREADACCGYRAVRRDTLGKRWGSWIANRVRNLALGEAVVDTGCSLKAFRAELVQDVQMWRGMHRFLPSIFLMQGARLKQVPVHHRPRAGGRSKYTNWGRLKETIWDLWAVRWMKKRHRPFRVEAQD